jgi:TonB family protein
MAETYSVFGSYLRFKEVLSDPLGHLYRAGEFDASGIRRITWLRIFDRPLIESSDLEGNFERALAIAEAVQSANLPSGVNCLVEDGAAALAIDYAASQPLSLVLERVAREQFPIPVDNALLIAEKIALALSATLSVDVEGGRVVHGFLHPCLIYVSNDGEAIVSGFGVGEQLLTVVDDQTAADYIHPYFAPEVLQSRAASSRGDVYSVGAILFHLLTGTALPAAPEDRGGAIDSATLAYDEEPVPDDIKSLLQRALAQHPEERFSSSADFKKELDRLLYGGAYSPTTFNLALFMDRLFRPEIEAEESAVERELAVDVTPYVTPVVTPEPVIETEVPAEPSFLKGREQWIGLGVVGVAVVAVILWLTVFRGPSTPPPPPTPTAAEIAAQRRQQEEKMKELAAGLVAEMMAEKEEEIRQELLDRQAKIDELQRRLAASERRAQQGDLSGEDVRRREELQRQIAAEEEAQRQREAELEAERQQAAEDARLQAMAQQTATAVAEAAAAAMVSPTPPPPPTPEPTAAPTEAPTAVPPPPPTATTVPTIEEGSFVDPTEVDSPPAIIKESPVVWSRAAIYSRRKGLVVLRVTVNADGVVEDLEVTRADHVGFGIPQAVKDAVRKYRFKPGTKNGVRIKTFHTIVARYDFTGR